MHRIGAMSCTPPQPCSQGQDWTHGNTWRHSCSACKSPPSTNDPNTTRNAYASRAPVVTWSRRLHRRSRGRRRLAPAMWPYLLHQQRSLANMSFPFPLALSWLPCLWACLPSPCLCLCARSLLPTAFTSSLYQHMPTRPNTCSPWHAVQLG